MPVDEHAQWKKIAFRLVTAAERIAEAETMLDELPNAGHIHGNLVPVRESVERFANLAVEKMEETRDGSD